MNIINIDKDYLVFLEYFIKRDFTIENNPIYKDFTIIGWKSLHFIYTWLRSLNEEKGKLFDLHRRERRHERHLL